MNTVCISTTMFTTEKVGDKTQGVPSTSKSRGNVPVHHVYAHAYHCSFTISVLYESLCSSTMTSPKTHKVGLTDHH